MDATTVPQMFLQMTERFAGDPTKYAYSRKINGAYTGITFSEVRLQVECFAVGLLELGIKPQDRVGIVSENRLEWIIADLAITSIGAINVAIFPTLTAKQQEYIFTDCEATCIIVSNSFQLNKLLKVSDDIPSIRQIIVMNHEAKGDHPLVTAGRARHDAVRGCPRTEQSAGHRDGPGLAAAKPLRRRAAGRARRGVARRRAAHPRCRRALRTDRAHVARQTANRLPSR